MKILYMVMGSEGLGIARRLVDEGNSVFAYSQNYPLAEEESKLIPVVSWREQLIDVDLVIGGSPGFSKYEEVIRKFGKPYVGMAKLGHMLNTRERLSDFLEICSVSEASDLFPKYILSGFFNGRDWVDPIVKSVIDERLAVGDLGPIVGTMGTVLCRCDNHKKLFDQLTIGFSRMGLRDMVSVFVNDEGVTAITCGLTYDILECIVEGSKDRLTDILWGLATGTLSDIDFTYDTVICVKLTTAPFPYHSEQGWSTILNGVSQDNLRHMFLDEDYEGKEGFFCQVATGWSDRYRQDGDDSVRVF